MTACTCPKARHRHGTRAMAAIHHCDCFHCRVARANSTRAYRNGQTWSEVDWAPSIGVRRRLQALAAIGHSASKLAPLLGMSMDYVSKLRADEKHAKIRPETYAAVAAVYDALWDQPDTSANGRRCSTQARRHGWVVPMAWDDDEIDDPAAIPRNPSGGAWDPKPCGTPAA